MLDKILEQIDIVIEIIKGEDPVLNQLIMDDFDYHYNCELRYEDVLALAKERNLIK